MRQYQGERQTRAAVDATEVIAGTPFKAANRFLYP